MNKRNAPSFTAKLSGKANVIITPTVIFISNTEEHINTAAIWDTGASGSAIAKSITDKLGLVPIGKTIVHTANGQAEQYTYMVDVGLPNGVKVNGLIVNEVPALSGNAEVLIGMDIITLGDFSITNFQGNTCMSFRVPSMHEIDYAQNPDLVVAYEEKSLSSIRMSKNGPCNCGSGKKYKNCHGKID
jgi:predicted aspartyl protease